MDGSPYLDVWKDAVLEVYIETLNAAGEYVPAVGLTGLQLRISATEHGAAIGTLTGAATERGASAPGYYYRVINLADLTSQLPALIYAHRSSVWVQLYSDDNIEVEAFRKIIRRTKG